MSNSRSRKLWAQHLAGQGKKKTSVDPSALMRKSPYAGRGALGVDPSLRGTGLAVLECDGKNRKLLHSETLKLTTKISSIECLGRIHASVANLIKLWQPRPFILRRNHLCPKFQNRADHGFSQRGGLVCGRHWRSARFRVCSFAG